MSKKSKDITFADIAKEIANKDYGSEMEKEQEHKLDDLLKYQEEEEN
jgi:hypothetical protein